MELELTVDQELFADTTRKFLDREAGADIVRALRDEPAGYDAAYWRRGCELGWTSLLVADDDGGGSVSGEGVRDLALVAYRFGRRAAPGPLIGCNVVAAALSRSGTRQQKDEVLGGILAGEVVAAWAVAEPRPDDGLGTIAMAAAPSPGGDGWSLTGTKLQVESAATASHALVTARAPQGPTQFLVPLDAPGVTVRPMQTVDLTRRFSAVTFATDVAADAVVGEVGGAAADVAWQLRLANVVQCAEMVGALDAVMDMTLEWVMDRYSFGRPLGSYQAIKHRLADMKTWLEASHALADGAAVAVQCDADDAGKAGNADELCSGAKAYIGHHGPELCQEGVQLHGGIGMTFDHDLHLYLRRVVLDATTHGTVADHRLRLTDILEARASRVAEGAA